MAEEPLTPEEQETMDLVIALRDTANLRPLVDVLRGGDGGPERARDALLLLGEWDVQMLAQIALDTLIDDYLVDPALVLQARRKLAEGTDDPFSRPRLVPLD